MESEYDEKIKELQVYLPALDRKINDARRKKNLSLSVPLDKLRNIVIKKIKVPMTILLKTEDAIKKFTKDIFISNKAEKVTENSCSGTSPNAPSAKKDFKIEIKQESGLGNTVDDDDVQFIQPKCSEIIILDDSDEEESSNKDPNCSKAQVPLNKSATGKDNVRKNEIPDPKSKEIVRVKQEQPETQNQYSREPINPLQPALEPYAQDVLRDPECNTIEHEENNKSKDVADYAEQISQKRDGYQDEVACSREKNYPMLSSSAERIPDCSIHQVIPQVKFDPSKVAESRDILQQIESQLKELSTAKKLSLSINDDDGSQKEDAVKEFLSRSTGSPASEKINFELQPCSDDFLQQSITLTETHSKKDDELSTAENSSVSIDDGSHKEDAAKEFLSRSTGSPASEKTNLELQPSSDDFLQKSTTIPETHSKKDDQLITAKKLRQPIYDNDDSQRKDAVKELQTRSMGSPASEKANFELQPCSDDFLQQSITLPETHAKKDDELSTAENSSMSIDDDGSHKEDAVKEFLSRSTGSPASEKTNFELQPCSDDFLQQSITLPKTHSRKEDELSTAENLSVSIDDDGSHKKDAVKEFLSRSFGSPASEKVNFELQPCSDDFLQPSITLPETHSKKDGELSTAENLSVSIDDDGSHKEDAVKEFLSRSTGSAASVGANFELQSSSDDFLQQTTTLPQMHSKKRDELSTAKKLLLPIDDDRSQKKDAVKEFLSKSTGSPASEKPNFGLQSCSDDVLLQSTILPELHSKKDDENSSSKKLEARKSLLPFPFPNFNQSTILSPEMATVKDTKSKSDKKLNAKKNTDQSTPTEITTQDYEKRTPNSVKTCDSQTTSDSIPPLNDETGSNISSTACASDSTANTRLSEIIASLKNNLSPSIEKMDPVATNDASSQKTITPVASAQPFPGLFDNKITLSDIPAVVQDMLNNSIETDEENRSGLVIDDSVNLSAQLLDDLDDYTINSIGNVSDLPEKILNAEDEDSLDLEISQAIAENGGLNVDSSDLPDVLELNDEILAESEKLELEISEADTKQEENMSEKNNSIENATKNTKLSEEELETNMVQTDKVIVNLAAISPGTNEKSVAAESAAECAQTMLNVEKPQDSCLSVSTDNEATSLAEVPVVAINLLIDQPQCEQQSNENAKLLEAKEHTNEEPDRSIATEMLTRAKDEMLSTESIKTSECVTIERKECDSTNQFELISNLSSVQNATIAVPLVRNIEDQPLRDESVPISTIDTISVDSRDATPDDADIWNDLSEAGITCSDRTIECQEYISKVAVEVPSSNTDLHSRMKAELIKSDMVTTNEQEIENGEPAKQLPENVLLHDVSVSSASLNENVVLLGKKFDAEVEDSKVSATEPALNENNIWFEPKQIETLNVSANQKESNSQTSLSVKNDLNLSSPCEGNVSVEVTDSPQDTKQTANKKDVDKVVNTQENLESDQSKIGDSIAIENTSKQVGGSNANSSVDFDSSRVTRTAKHPVVNDKMTSNSPTSSCKIALKSPKEKTRPTAPSTVSESSKSLYSISARPVKNVTARTNLTSQLKAKTQKLSKTKRDRNDVNDLKSISTKTLPEATKLPAKPNAPKDIVTTKVDSQYDLAILEQQKAELERKICELKKEPQADLESISPLVPKSSNLSEISESDADCVSLSLSLSDISDPESGEITDKPPVTLRTVCDIKNEPSEVSVSNRIKFATDSANTGAAALRVTIPNDDLRLKLTNKRKKRKHKKRTKHCRMEIENADLADEIEPPFSPIRYVDFKGNVRLVRDASTSGSDEELLNISPRKPKRRSLKSKQKASELLENPLYSRLDFMKAEDDDSFLSYEENLEINNMQKYPDDDKCRIQSKLRYRSPNFDENTRFSLQDDVEYKNTSRLPPVRGEVSTRSPSPKVKLERKRSKSPKRFVNQLRRSVSPRVKIEKVEKYSRSPGRRSNSPMRLPKSPNRFTLRRSPSPRVKLERRHSRSPRRLSPRRAYRTTRSPNERLASPRRRSRSPRRFPRSPRRRSRSPLRISRSPRRRARSPINRTRSPRRSSRSPRRLQRSPRRIQRSPRRFSRSPRRRSRSPRRLSRSPRRLSRSPRRISRSPRRLSRSPRRLSRSPRRLSRSPRRLSRSPRRLSRSPRKLSRSPRRLSRSPRRLSRSPRRLSRSPRRLSRTPRRLSKSPRKLSRSPRKLSRSPRRLSRSPRRCSPRRLTLRQSQSPSRLKRPSISPQRITEDPKEVTSVIAPPVVAAIANNEVTSSVPSPKPVVYINLSDTDEEEENAEKQPDNLVEEEEGVDFTIEVSDDEDFVQAPPPPPKITAEELKHSPKTEVEESAQAPNEIERELTTERDENDVIFIDDDVEAVKSPNFQREDTIKSGYEALSTETTMSTSKTSNELQTSEAQIMKKEQANESEQSQVAFSDTSDAENSAAQETEKTLEEKNLNELHEIKVKLEKEIGIDSDLLTQIIGNAIDKINGPSISNAVRNGADASHEQSALPTMVSVSPYFYQSRVQSAMAHVSSKDPRLNRVRPAPTAPVSSSTPGTSTTTDLMEAPPPPLIPRLTPAVALPQSSQPSKSRARTDSFSDEDYISSGTISDENSHSGSEKGKEFITIEVSKLEEIISQQIQKVLAANKSLLAPQGADTMQTKKVRQRKDSTVEKAKQTEKAKPMKNACSKDGSGPRHMNADKILSEILKGSTPTNESIENETPEKSKPAKPRRILNRIESSPEADTGNTRERDVGKARKSPVTNSDTLRNRITHDTAGIIKLGKTSSSTKIKPKPALKQAERTQDVNLLTPLREMPYEESRRKRPDSQKRAPKNTDQSMHCNLEDASCLLCKDKGVDDLISHYVNIHREHEVYLARLTAEQAETLKESPNSVQPTRSSNIEKFCGKCPFCTEEMTVPIGRFMEHFASHTGEYAYECDHCGWRYSRKRDILNHCNTECPKGAKFIYVYRYDLSDKVIEGYICSHCNYTQLNKANVVKHIRGEHDQQQVKSDDFTEVTLLKVRERQPGDEDETLDNIEVGNEAIADEDDDYDNYEDVPVSPASDTDKREPNPGEAIEYVKNELLLDAIDDIDWKSLEDTLVADSIEEIPKPPPVETDQEISKQIFTEIHANLQENVEIAKDAELNLKPMTIVKTNDENGPSVEANFTVEMKANLEVSGNDTPVGSPKSPVSKSNSVKKSKNSKRIEFKDVTLLGQNVFRVYSVGFGRLRSNELQYHCLFKDCNLAPTNSLEDLRRHMKSHGHKWTGECVACKRDKSKISNKLFPVSREILHLVNEHLPNKSCAGKTIRPWLTNDPSNCQKSKEICEMLKREFHLENLYKCMGSNCLFTTNSSQDMQFHVTLNHSQDMGALYCCYCEEDFIHCNGLVDHIAKVHGASKYQCSQCFYRSCAAYNVQMHQRTFHTDQRDLKIIICSDQAHTFSTEMLELLDNRQKNVKPLKCPMFSACRKWIYVKHLLMDHIVKDHSHKEPINVYSPLYDCIHCMYGSEDLLSIRQHMANEHPNRLLYVCGLVFIKSLHPLATQGSQIDITSIKTTSLVYIGGKVNESRFVIKNPANHVFDINSIEAVNSGKDVTALNDRIRQTFGEAAVKFSDVETYVRKIAEGMTPDTIQEDENGELDQLINAAVKNTGLIGKDLYKCGFPKCGEALDTFEQFDRHISSHQGNKKEPLYRCPHCNNIVATNQIRMHTIQHRRHRHICFFCGKSTASQNLAIEHLRKEHQSQSNHFVYLTKDTDWTSVLGENECRIFVAMPRKCNDDVKEKLLAILRKSSGLETLEEKPIVERPSSPIERKEETPVPVFVALDSRLRCNMDACPFVAKTEDELMQHFGERHRILLSGMYSCPHCPYNMGTAQLNINRIKNHLLYHGPTIVVCNVCNYYHYNRSRVLNHIASCHPYNFVTLTLNARSSSGTKSKIEILYNKNVRSPEDNYKCTICDAILTECEELFHHMRESHQLNVGFKCDACPFFDNSQAQVDAHARKAHTGEGTIRIRSVFLPIGGKWMKNLSPFELLIACNEDANETLVKTEDSNRNNRTNLEQNEIQSTASVPDSTVKLSESQVETRKSPPKSPSQTTSDSKKKRKLEEDTGSTRDSKKSRRSGVKRPVEGTSDESSKRPKVSSPPRIPSPANRTESEENSGQILLSILSDTPNKVPTETAVNSPAPKLKLVPVEKLLRADVVNNFEGRTLADRYPSLEELLRQENPPPALPPSMKDNLFAQTKQPPSLPPSMKDNLFAQTNQPLSLPPSMKDDSFAQTNQPARLAQPQSSPVNAPVPADVQKTLFSPPISAATKLQIVRIRPAQDDVFLLCVYCGIKSECFAKLRSHFRVNHLNDPVHFRISKKLLCAYCNTYSTFAELKVHHFEAHENDLFITREGNYHKKCAECSFVYSKIRELKNHCELEHKALYLEMHSSFEYLNQEFLMELLKIGTGQVADVFKCPSCDHKYLQEAVYMNHVLHSHSQTPRLLPERGPTNRILFGCGQCKVFFDTELRAIQHIRKHIDPYGCNQCELSFATHSALLNHYHLFHKTHEQTYQLRNSSVNMQKFLEMLLRFPTGLILSKLECAYTDYGHHDQFIQRIESMEKAELHAKISQQQRTEQIESITRIKIEIEKEADMFCQATNCLGNATSGQ